LTYNLPGAAQLAKLRGHALRGGFQNFTGEAPSKNVKSDSGGARSCVEGVLGGCGSISRFEQTKDHRKPANRHVGKLFYSGRFIIVDSNKIVKLKEDRIV
jgi:hypothetical protein